MSVRLFSRLTTYFFLGAAVCAQTNTPSTPSRTSPGQKLSTVPIVDDLRAINQLTANQLALRTYADPKGATYFAAGLTGPEIVSKQPSDLAIVLDLSAGQSGVKFQATLDLVRRIAGKLSDGRMVIYHSIDSGASKTALPLHANSPELKAKLDQLATLTPMGTFNWSEMIQSMDTWFTDVQTGHRKQIVYIGDGRLHDFGSQHADP